MKKSRKRVFKGGSRSKSKSRTKVKSEFQKMKNSVMSNSRRPEEIGCKNISVLKSIIGDYKKEIKKLQDIVASLEDEREVFEIENRQLREIINNKNNC